MLGDRVSMNQVEEDVGFRADPKEKLVLLHGSLYMKPEKIVFCNLSKLTRARIFVRFILAACVNLPFRKQIVSSRIRAENRIFFAASYKVLYEAAKNSYF